MIARVPRKEIYFILRDNNYLYHYNIKDKLQCSENKKIDLMDIERISVIDDGSKQCKFEIETSNRTWVLKVGTNDERKKWVKLIEQQCRKLIHKVSHICCQSHNCILKSYLFA